MNIAKCKQPANRDGAICGRGKPRGWRKFSGWKFTSQFAPHFQVWGASEDTRFRIESFVILWNLVFLVVVKVTVESSDYESKYIP